MSDTALRARPAKAKPGIKRWIWLTAAVGTLLLIAANAHLVYVAVMSQPDCVAHARPGEAGGMHAFGAAQSSCSPTRTK
jgi:hypothetical protein